jgi:hypothetical protein
MRKERPLLNQPFLDQLKIARDHSHRERMFVHKITSIGRDHLAGEEYIASEFNSVPVETGQKAELIVCLLFGKCQPSYEGSRSLLRFPEDFLKGL